MAVCTWIRVICGEENDMEKPGESTWTTPAAEKIPDSWWYALPSSVADVRIRVAE